MQFTTLDMEFFREGDALAYQTEPSAVDGYDPRGRLGRTLGRLGRGGIALLVVFVLLAVLGFALPNA